MDILEKLCVSRMHQVFPLPELIEAYYIFCLVPIEARRFLSDSVDGTVNEIPDSQSAILAGFFCSESLITSIIKVDSVRRNGPLFEAKRSV